MNIWYLGHSSWALELGITIIFDYGREPIRGERGKFEDGIVEFKNLEGDILFFVSHRHSDHYSKYIHKTSQDYPNIKFILGNIRSSYLNSIRLKPYTESEINDLRIYTSASTDEGVSFLIDTGDFTIYHAGDNACWESKLETKYKSEIDYISNIKSNIDIAFLPAASFSNSISSSMMEGAEYAITRLKPKNVFPMHGNNLEFLYSDFKDNITKKGFNTNVLVASHIGQKFVLN